MSTPSNQTLGALMLALALFVPNLARADESVEKALGPDHPNVAVSLQNLAALY